MSFLSLSPSKKSREEVPKLVHLLKSLKEGWCEKEESKYLVFSDM